MRRWQRIGLVALAWASNWATTTRADMVVHLINDAGLSALSVLNAGAPFVTSFKGIDDVTLTTSGSVGPNYVDNYPAASPGAINNPAFITGFVGSASSGTGDGTAGGISFLNPRENSTLTIDFSIPLVAGDKILLSDIDSFEHHTIRAFALVNNVLTAVSLAGWIRNAYSGETGQLPDSTWGRWDPTGGGPTTGTFDGSGPSNGPILNLNEPLDVLTVDQPISRIVFTSDLAGGATPGIQFFHPQAVPEPSSLALCGIAALSWLGFAASRRHRDA